MHPKKPKGLSLDLGFQFFEYLGFGFGFGYFSNLLYGLEYKFKKLEKKIKIDTQINTQKFFLSYKLSNSKFAKDLQNTQTQILIHLLYTNSFIIYNFYNFIFLNLFFIYESYVFNKLGGSCVSAFGSKLFGED